MALTPYQKLPESPIFSHSGRVSLTQKERKPCESTETDETRISQADSIQETVVETATPAATHMVRPKPIFHNSDLHLGTLFSG